jgi:hypothetical protein
MREFETTNGNGNLKQQTAVDDPWLGDKQYKGRLPYWEELEAEIEIGHSGQCERQDVLDACASEQWKCAHLRRLV